MHALSALRRAGCAGHSTTGARQLQVGGIENSVAGADDITRRAGIDQDSRARAIDRVPADGVVVGSAHCRECGQVYPALSAVA